MQDQLSEEEAKSGNDLLTLMGNVLSTWQGVEHTIADIYMVFFRPARADAAAVTFYAVRGFRDRLGMVDALIAFFCADEQKEQWGDLAALARRRSRSRNAVAHGLVQRHGSHPNREYRIGQSFYDVLNFPDPSQKQASSYNIKELKDICRMFLELTVRLDAFRDGLASDPALRARLSAPQQQFLANEAAYPLTAQTPPKP
jgi:hypothetical protein